MATYCAADDFSLSRNVFIAINVLVITSTLPMIYKFIKSHMILKRTNTERWQKLKCVYLIGLIFILATILTLFTLLPIMLCIKEYSLFYLFRLFFYIQTYCLLLLSFVRIHGVFKDTFLRLSKYQIVFRIILFSILFIVIASAFGRIFINFSPNISSIFEAITSSMVFVLITILSLSIMILFISKLVQVMKSNNDSELIGVITQLSLLTFISITITLSVPICLITFIFILDLPQIYIEWIREYILLFDTATNFWCIMLSFKAMNGYYIMICGCIDNKCRKLWSRKMNKNDNMDIVLPDVNPKVSTAATDSVSINSV